MIIIFIVFCAFLSLISVLKINKLEDIICNLNIEFSIKNESLIRSLNETKLKINYLHDEYLDQIKDLKHDIYHKTEKLFDERIQYHEESLAPYFCTMDQDIQEIKKQLDENLNSLTNRKTDTFKKLKAAFSMSGKLDEDND